MPRTDEPTFEHRVSPDPRVERSLGNRFFDYVDLSVSPEWPTVVRIGRKYGLMNAAGKIVVRPQYEMLRSFREGFAIVKTHGKWGFLDSTGRIAVPAVYDLVQQFEDGRAPVMRGGKWSVIDTAGNLLCDFQFDAVSPKYSEGFLGVEINGKYGYIDRDAKFVWTPTN